MTPTAYYNEIDPFAAQWLRNLIAAGHIAPGVVDERSISEVTPDEIKEFTQCHFFAGIGGWPLALNLAGVSERENIWTGSPPCQPFSVAGNQLGQIDERHLAPIFMRLVAQCRPSILFGEQVAAAIGKHWLDDLFTELEREGYACGAAVLPACSVGAPHKRNRLFLGAELLADSNSVGSYGRRFSKECPGQNQRCETSIRAIKKHGVTGLCAACDMADFARYQRQSRVSELNDQKLVGSSVMADGTVVYPDNEQQSTTRHEAGDANSCGPGQTFDAVNPHQSFWSNADWLSCRDGKFRPVEPGTFPVANGISARVGRLRGYGNAIVPQVAAQFITAFMAACND